MVDAELLAESVRTWWLELIGILVAIAGGALAYGAGDPLQGALALAVFAAFVDRVRLRLDNRSLTSQIRQFQGRLREQTGE